MLRSKVAAVQVMNQVIVFGWSSASWPARPLRSLSRSQCRWVRHFSEIVTTLDLPHITASDLQLSSKDTSPALESASQSGAAVFIRWRFCWESATAASVSLGNTLFCWSSPTHLSQDAQNGKTQDPVDKIMKCVTKMSLPGPSKKRRLWVYRFTCKNWLNIYV